MSIKSMILTIAVIVFFALVITNLDAITNYTVNIINPTPTATIGEANGYETNNDYEFVQKSKDFIPYSRQDILNIFYSLLDNGYDTFTFYCPSEYISCLDDVESIANDETVITNIGNFVHPYNNFTSLKVQTDSLGEVNVIVNKLYTNTQIDEINKMVDSIFKENLTNDMDVTDKMLKMHDYIIDNTYYDTEAKDEYGSAYSLFKEGKAKCSGYADAMAIILSRLGIKNYKVASEEHVWNAVYLDNDWYHMDLTWDDPIVSNGANITETIRHKFYMIDTPTLLSYDTKEHNFNQAVFREVV